MLMSAEAPERIPIFKDGKPGWIVAYDSTIRDGDFADILMEDGRETYVRLPDYGRRITPRVVEPVTLRDAVTEGADALTEALDRDSRGKHPEAREIVKQTRELLRAVAREL